MCSKCYRDRNSTGAAAVSSPAPRAQPVPMTVDIPPPAPKVNVEPVAPPPVAAAVASPAKGGEGEAETTPKKKKKIRCLTCNKKLGLLGFDCRCGHVFCANHRHPDTHSCTIDYKELGRERLRKDNEAVVADKLQNRI